MAQALLTALGRAVSPSPADLKALGSARRQGYGAGFHGQAVSCPFSNPDLTEAWLSGVRQGQQAVARKQAVRFKQALKGYQDFMSGLTAPAIKGHSTGNLNVSQADVGQDESPIGNRPDKAIQKQDVSRMKQNGRPADFQKQKMYDWEKGLMIPALHQPITDMTELTALVWQVCRDYQVPLLTVQDGRGRSATSAFRWRVPVQGRPDVLMKHSLTGNVRAVSLSIPKAGRLVRIVLHETAHYLTHCQFGLGATAGHGAEFVGTLVELFSRYVGLDKQALIDDARRSGVAVAEGNIHIVEGQAWQANWSEDDDDDEGYCADCLGCAECDFSPNPADDCCPAPAVPADRFSNILYEGKGRADSIHQQVEVLLSEGAESNTVKAVLDNALQEQCGHRHYLTARRINSKGLVLNWSVKAYCFPEGFAPKTITELKATCPDGLETILRPADKEKAQQVAEGNADLMGRVVADLVLADVGQDCCPASPYDDDPARRPNWKAHISRQQAGQVEQDADLDRPDRFRQVVSLGNGYLTLEGDVPFIADRLAPIVSDGLNDVVADAVRLLSGDNIGQELYLGLVRTKAGWMAEGLLIPEDSPDDLDEGQGKADDVGQDVSPDVSDVRAIVEQAWQQAGKQAVEEATARLPVLPEMPVKGADRPAVYVVKPDEGQDECPVPDVIRSEAEAAEVRQAIADYLADRPDRIEPDDVGQDSCPAPRADRRLPAWRQNPDRPLADNVGTAPDVEGQDSRPADKEQMIDDLVAVVLEALEDLEGLGLVEYVPDVGQDNAPNPEVSLGADDVSRLVSNPALFIQGFRDSEANLPASNPDLSYKQGRVAFLEQGKMSAWFQGYEQALKDLKADFELLQEAGLPDEGQNECPVGTGQDKAVLLTEPYLLVADGCQHNGLQVEALPWWPAGKIRKAILEGLSDRCGADAHQVKANRFRKGKGWSVEVRCLDHFNIRVCRPTTGSLLPVSNLDVGQDEVLLAERPDDGLEVRQQKSGKYYIHSTRAGYQQVAATGPYGLMLLERTYDDRDIAEATLDRIRELLAEQNRADDTGQDESPVNKGKGKPLLPVAVLAVSDVLGRQVSSDNADDVALVRQVQNLMRPGKDGGLLTSAKQVAYELLKDRQAVGSDACPNPDDDADDGFRVQQDGPDCYRIVLAPEAYRQALSASRYVRLLLAGSYVSKAFADSALARARRCLEEQARLEGQGSDLSALPSLSGQGSGLVGCQGPAEGQTGQAGLSGQEQGLEGRQGPAEGRSGKDSRPEPAEPCPDKARAVPAYFAETALKAGTYRPETGLFETRAELAGLENRPVQAKAGLSGQDFQGQATAGLLAGAGLEGLAEGLMLMNSLSGSPVSVVVCQPDDLPAEGQDCCPVPAEGSVRFQQGKQAGLKGSLFVPADACLDYLKGNDEGWAIRLSELAARTGQDYQPEPYVPDCSALVPVLPDVGQDRCPAPDDDGQDSRTISKPKGLLETLYPLKVPVVRTVAPAEVPKGYWYALQTAEQPEGEPVACWAGFLTSDCAKRHAVLYLTRQSSKGLPLSCFDICWAHSEDAVPDVEGLGQANVVSPNQIVVSADRDDDCSCRPVPVQSAPTFSRQADDGQDSRAVLDAPADVRVRLDFQTGFRQGTADAEAGQNKDTGLPLPWWKGYRLGQDTWQAEQVDDWMCGFRAGKQGLPADEARNTALYQKGYLTGKQVAARDRLLDAQQGPSRQTGQSGQSGQVKPVEGLLGAEQGLSDEGQDNCPVAFADGLPTRLQRPVPVCRDDDWRAGYQAGLLGLDVPDNATRAYRQGWEQAQDEGQAEDEGQDECPVLADRKQAEQQQEQASPSLAVYVRLDRPGFQQKVLAGYKAGKDNLKSTDNDVAWQKGYVAGQRTWFCLRQNPDEYQAGKRCGFDADCLLPDSPSLPFLTGYNDALLAVALKGQMTEWLSVLEGQKPCWQVSLPGPVTATDHEGDIQALSGLQATCWTDGAYKFWQLSAPDDLALPEVSFVLPVRVNSERQNILTCPEDIMGYRYYDRQQAVQAGRFLHRHILKQQHQQDVGQDESKLPEIIVKGNLTLDAVRETVWKAQLVLPALPDNPFLCIQHSTADEVVVSRAGFRTEQQARKHCLALLKARSGNLLDPMPDDKGLLFAVPVLGTGSVWADIIWQQSKDIGQDCCPNTAPWLPEDEGRYFMLSTAAKLADLETMKDRPKAMVSGYTGHILQQTEEGQPDTVPVADLCWIEEDRPLLACYKDTSNTIRALSEAYNRVCLNLEPADDRIILLPAGQTAGLVCVENHLPKNDEGQDCSSPVVVRTADRLPARQLLAGTAIPRLPVLLSAQLQDDDGDEEHPADNELNVANRTLFHSDNLPILKGLNSNSVDLIATDPPFQKGKDFHATPDSLSAGAGFQDRWKWTAEHLAWTNQITEAGYPDVADTIRLARSCHSDDMGAFLSFLAVRLIECRRILKATGSVYIHSDFTANSYIRILLDNIFGHNNFRNEIAWCYTGPANTTKNFPRKHDTILFYAGNKAVFHKDNVRVKYKKSLVGSVGKGTGNIWDEGHDIARLSELDNKGKVIEDWWTDIPAGSHIPKKERVGYPTQKPLALYERLILASSNPNDVVLDPFAGCATTAIAAERLGRQWVAIDLWEQAYKVVLKRLEIEGLAVPDSNYSSRLTFADIHYRTDVPKRTDQVDAKPVPILQTPISIKSKGRLTGHQKALLKQQLLALTGLTCAGCDRVLPHPDYLDIDHKLPLSDGGDNGLDNACLLCQPCNRLKSNTYTLSGLRKVNKKQGFMADQQTEGLELWLT